MSRLIEANEKMMEATDEVMNLALKSSDCSLNNLKYIDEDQFKLLQASLRLMDAAKEYQEVTVKVIDDMDKKLSSIEKMISEMAKKKAPN